MKLEVGKEYRTRSGRRMRVVAEYPGNDYPFHAYSREVGLFFAYLPNGHFLLERLDHEDDIVAEWEEQPAPQERVANDKDPQTLWADLLLETVRKIDAIDKQTPWQEMEPAWWLSMQDIRRRLAGLTAKENQ